MTFKTSKINKNDLIEAVTNLYEVMTIILMEGQVREGLMTDKECDMRTQVVSMGISRVMIEIFPPEEVSKIFSLIQTRLDDKDRNNKRKADIAEIIKKKKATKEE